MTEKPYRICTRCIMDTSDPDISFDREGVCNHCHQYDRMVQEEIFTGDTGQEKLSQLVSRIRESGKGNDYDCLIGVSGGVDSSYVAYVVKKLGLRPLAVHLDNGWDSELSVNNIFKELEILGIDLKTHVINWNEFRDLQLAFLKASTPDSEIPSDHAIVSIMYRIAEEFGITYVITGRNVRTETHVPLSWSHGHHDWKYIKSVHEMFGTVPLTTYPFRTPSEERRYRKNQVWVDILNYVDYVKKDAIQILEDELGWEYYGGKHYESIYTRFFQGYILPKKFGYDKRRGHLSSLICSGEITRDDALNEMENEPYPQDLQEEDRRYVIKKLGITEEEFESIMNLPLKTILDYPSYERDNRTIPRQMVIAAGALKNSMIKRLSHI
ncbi:MAG: hypothetical protein BWY45_02943 [Euryarchaeota archaeon ADurb.Bin294]|nr:MAG: hypothetical protein BWY45_02943 [Euryarchaeota archaeon ADurb.Bin294]